MTAAPPLTRRQNGDDTALYYSSLALMTFQRAYGLFPRIMGKGDAAGVSHQFNITAERNPATRELTHET